MTAVVACVWWNGSQAGFQTWFMVQPGSSVGWLELWVLIASNGGASHSHVCPSEVLIRVSRLVVWGIPGASQEIHRNICWGLPVTPHYRSLDTALGITVIDNSDSTWIIKKSAPLFFYSVILWLIIWMSTPTGHFCPLYLLISSWRTLHLRGKELVHSNLLLCIPIVAVFSVLISPSMWSSLLP